MVSSVISVRLTSSILLTSIVCKKVANLSLQALKVNKCMMTSSELQYFFNFRCNVFKDQCTLMIRIQIGVTDSYNTNSAGDQNLEVIQ